MRLILASKSPARLSVLQRVGLDPEVMVSGFDESTIRDDVAHRLAERLAVAKGETVLPMIEGDAIVVACDSVLERDGRPRGKPRDRQRAIEEWKAMRASEGVLYTGHFVWVRQAGQERQMTRTRGTVVRFADLTDSEIEAYAATGEPLDVAGAFTLDGKGGAFVTHMVGDPYNVTGISPSLLRQILLDLGVQWHTLWD